ncbi:MAG: methyltransferase family protein [Bdellovibrio sp.]
MKNTKAINLLNYLSKFLIIIVMALPAVAFFVTPNFEYKKFITILLYGIIIERIWFSLFTTKEGKTQKKKTTDWSLILVTYTYLGFLCTLIYDVYFQGHQQINWIKTVIGILCMTISYLIRNWSVFHLNDQWASHLELTNTSNRFLIRSGPYAYVRHPIYAAAIIEFVGMYLLFGGSNSLFFLILIAIPSVIYRAFYEEKVSKVNFGDTYFKYMMETGRFLPAFRKY